MSHRCWADTPPKKQNKGENLWREHRRGQYPTREGIAQAQAQTARYSHAKRRVAKTWAAAQVAMHVEVFVSLLGSR
jgi:hypothetical protein